MWSFKFLNNSFSDNNFSNRIFIEKNLSVPWYLRGAHKQTLIGYYLRGRKLKSISTQSHVIQLDDGDQLWVEYNFNPQATKIIYLFHGLSGSIDSSYMQRMAFEAIRNDLSVVLVNHRGCGQGKKLTNKFPYHSGRGEDVLKVLKWGTSQFEHHEHIVIGYSLGGSAVLNAMIDLSNNNSLKSKKVTAIAVNAPLSLHKSANELCFGKAKIYGKNFVLELKKEVKVKSKLQGIKPIKPIFFLTI